MASVRGWVECCHGGDDGRLRLCVCVFVSVCMYVCMYLCMYVCVYAVVVVASSSFLFLSVSVASALRVLTIAPLHCPCACGGIAGGSLYHVLHQSAVEWPVDRQKFVCRQLAAGLAYLHSIDIVHNDIKAHNLLVRW